MRALILTILALTLQGRAQDDPGREEEGIRVSYSFDAPDQADAFAATATGPRLRKDSGPKLHEGGLYLLQSWCDLTTSVAFPAPSEERYRVVEISFELLMNTGTEGAGFAWLALEHAGLEGEAPAVEAWEAPDLPGTFGVGFDARNPPNRDPFRGSGNVHDRPQHEISLHWDGMEIVKATTPEDFRDEQPHQVQIRIAFVPGGAEISVTLDGAGIFEQYFLPTMTAYPGRPAFGGRNAETAGDVLLDDLSILLKEPIPAPEPPLVVTAIDHQLNDKAHPRNEAVVQLPEDTSPYARIICTLRLDQPETRFDPWDRIAHIWTTDKEGKRFEILRYITPYHRGHVWRVDVTDLRPLLQGKRTIVQECGTQGEGWVVTVAFSYYPGAAERHAHRVVNLWSGKPEIGNPEKPVSDFYVPRTVPLEAGTVAARVRLVVTGHGMFPNSKNAGEFMPLGRTLVVNGQEFRNVLWKTDNYLNPCRPQGGTWKYDRAGWAPGDVVRPWLVEATGCIDETRTLTLEYRLDDYVNEGRGKTWAPTHVTEAQLILYRAP